jgi:hypothetical protein
MHNDLVRVGVLMFARGGCCHSGRQQIAGDGLHGDGHQRIDTRQSCALSSGDLGRLVAHVLDGVRDRSLFVIVMGQRPGGASRSGRM